MNLNAQQKYKEPHDQILGGIFKPYMAQLATTISFD